MTEVESAHELAEAGLFRDAAKAIDESRSVSEDLKVLRARLEIDVGNPLEARLLATNLLNDRLAPRHASSCWEIVGRVELGVGEIDRGLKAMNQAFAAAERSDDPRTKARLIAANCDALLHWIGIESAAAEIPRLGQAAIASGDPYCLVAFHSLVAELKAKKGLLAGAKRSGDAARGLLQRWPNVWQKGRLAATSAGIHLIESDYELAQSATMEALECAEKSGSRRIRIPALGNLAHIKLAQGDLAEATRAVSEFLAIVQKGGNTEIAALDTQLQIALAQGDLKLSSQLALNALEKSAGLEGGASYHGLWLALTRVKLLFRIGDFNGGVDLALGAIPQVERTADRNLSVRMKLLAAEGLGRVGKPLEAVSLLAEAVDSSGHSSLEILAEAMRVSGRITASEGPATARGYFERAAHILEAVGNSTARSEILRDAEETIGTSDLESVAPQLLSGISASEETPRQSHSQIAIVTERISDLLRLAAVPPLLGKEFLGLLADSGSVHQAAVVATNKDGRLELVAKYPAKSETVKADHPAAVRMPLGTFRDGHYEIIALPLTTTSARVTVLSIERLVQTALTLMRAQQLEREQATLWTEQTPERQLGLIYSSDRMLGLVKTIRRVADSNITVLLVGETGVGKELFARALHQASVRSDRVFMPFNCSTVPRDMFDSQLFGHKRGSFTGAHEDAPGVIRSASGGTLFLDEIGEMSMDVQPKLLRFLESGEVQPLGDPKPRLVDVRIVAATNANLDQLVAGGRFREDLYYRLNVIRINIPPLRERREEIPALVEHFLEKFGRELQKPMLRIADDTLEYLVLYRWPGNVRQLSNEIRRMVALAEPGSVLMPAHLSDDIAASRRTIAVDAPPRQSTEVVTRIDQPLAAAVEHIERAAIQRAITLADGRLDDAARSLGLSRKGLYLKRQRLKLD